MNDLLEEAVDLGLEPGEEAMAFAKAESPIRIQRLLAERTRSPQASPVRVKPLNVCGVSVNAGFLIAP